MSRRPKHPHHSETSTPLSTVRGARGEIYGKFPNSFAIGRPVQGKPFDPLLRFLLGYAAESGNNFQFLQPAVVFVGQKDLSPQFRSEEIVDDELRKIREQELWAGSSWKKLSYTQARRLFPRMHGMRMAEGAAQRLSVRLPLEVLGVEQNAVIDHFTSTVVRHIAPEVQVGVLQGVPAEGLQELASAMAARCPRSLILGRVGVCSLTLHSAME